MILLCTWYNSAGKKDDGLGIHKNIEMFSIFPSTMVAQKGRFQVPPQRTAVA